MSTDSEGSFSADSRGVRASGSADASLFQKLVLIGSISTYDPDKSAMSTILSMCSHFNVFTRNGYEIEKETLTKDIEKKLDSLRTIHGDLLASQYKIQILATLKRLWPNEIHISDSYLKALREGREDRRSVIGSRAASNTFMSGAMHLIHSAALILGRTRTEKRIEDLGMHDTCLAIILSTSTSLRINEIQQLTLLHLDVIRREEPIAIHSKGSGSRGPIRKIMLNDLLLTIISHIKSERSKSEQAVKISHQTNRSPAYKRKRIKKGLVTLSSVTYMYKKLRELAASSGVNLPKLGFNTFRKCTTTLLIQGGAHMLAKTINNHEGFSTTYNNYNVMRTEGAERTMDMIHGVISPEMNTTSNGNSSVPKRTRKKPVVAAASSTTFLEDTYDSDERGKPKKIKR